MKLVENKCTVCGLPTERVLHGSGDVCLDCMGRIGEKYLPKLEPIEEFWETMHKAINFAVERSIIADLDLGLGK